MRRETQVALLKNTGMLLGLVAVSVWAVLEPLEVALALVLTIMVIAIERQSLDSQLRGTIAERQHPVAD